VLDAVRVEGLDLAAVPGDDQFDEDLPLRGEEEALQAVRVFQLGEGLGRGRGGERGEEVGWVGKVEGGPPSDGCDPAPREPVAFFVLSLSLSLSSRNMPGRARTSLVPAVRPLFSPIAPP
jgi:hypothetical protein